MPRSQLAINCPAPLMERLKAAAAERGATITTLVLAWVEAGLDAGLDASRPVPRSGLDQRLDAVERRLDALEAPAPPKPASPRQGTAASPEKATAAPSPKGDTGGAITTAELAARTSTNLKSWNNWAVKATPGDTRHHPDAGGWQLVGKAVADAGGPPRWLWLSVSASPDR